MASGSGDPTYNPSVPPRIILALLLTLVACSGGATQNPTQAATPVPTQTAAQTACEAAMAKAAAVDEMHDTVRDLDDAIRACETVGEMQDAARKYPTALDEVPAETFARNRCSSEPTLADNAICRTFSPSVPGAYYTQIATDVFAGFTYFTIPKAAVAIDYRVTGTCLFGFRLFAEASEADNVDTPRLKPSGAEVAGTWQLTVKPGRYGLGGGGDGCSWSVTVREDR
jgi:hypothetical protein